MNIKFATDIDFETWPEMSEQEWSKMTYPKDYGETNLWLINWLKYGIKHNYITFEDVINALEEVENG